MANNEYWKNRVSNSITNFFDKNQKQLDRQLRKQYKAIATRAISDYESVYNKLIATVGEGKQPTPADLYKLDKYWEHQAQVRQQLKRLGEKNISRMTKIFELQYFDTYYGLKLDGLTTYNKLDTNIVTQVINSIWCADGKSWSQRIWNNITQLQETLNDGLVQCVAAGKPSSYLKKQLMERFNVSYSNADSIARTELAHIQTQSAQQRYKDYGIEEMQVWTADKTERTCPICRKEHGKVYKVTDQMPVPFHPRCRCTMIPVVKTNNNQ